MKSEKCIQNTYIEVLDEEKQISLLEEKEQFLFSDILNYGLQVIFLIRSEKYLKLHISSSYFRKKKSSLKISRRRKRIRINRYSYKIRNFAPLVSCLLIREDKSQCHCLMTIEQFNRQKSYFKYIIDIPHVIVHLK
jgi:hypothetical protein